MNVLEHICSWRDKLITLFKYIFEVMEGSFTQVSHYTIPVSRALTISTVVLFLKETLQTEIHFVYYFPLLISN